jgi:hypothetical protein
VVQCIVPTVAARVPLRQAGEANLRIRNNAEYARHRRSLCFDETPARSGQMRLELGALLGREVRLFADERAELPRAVDELSTRPALAARAILIRATPGRPSRGSGHGSGGPDGPCCSAQVMRTGGGTWSNSPGFARIYRSSFSRPVPATPPITQPGWASTRGPVSYCQKA